MLRHALPRRAFLAADPKTQSPSDVPHVQPIFPASAEEPVEGRGEEGRGGGCGRGQGGEAPWKESVKIREGDEVSGSRRPPRSGETSSSDQTSSRCWCRCRGRSPPRTVPSLPALSRFSAPSLLSYPSTPLPFPSPSPRYQADVCSENYHRYNTHGMLISFTIAYCIMRLS